MNISIDENYYKGMLEKGLRIYNFFDIFVNGNDPERKGKLNEWEIAIILEDLIKDFDYHYQLWYTQSLIFLKEVLPYRLSEFISLYEKSKNRTDITEENFVMQDFVDINNLPQNLGTDKCLELGFKLIKKQYYIIKSFDGIFKYQNNQ